MDDSRTFADIEIPLAGFGEALDVNLEPLFDPDTIAAIGASATEGKPGYGAMNADFEGPLSPVGPNGEGEDG